MPQLHFMGVRYAIREPAMLTSLQVWCDLGTVEGRAIVARAVAGERFSVHLEDLDAAYCLAAELLELGVNVEADESDY